MPVAVVACRVLALLTRFQMAMFSCRSMSPIYQGMTTPQYKAQATGMFSRCSAQMRVLSGAIPFVYPHHSTAHASSPPVSHAAVTCMVQQARGVKAEFVEGAF